VAVYDEIGFDAFDKYVYQLVINNLLLLLLNTLTFPILSHSRYTLVAKLPLRLVHFLSYRSCNYG
jgi:hypothetical protein